MDLHEHAANIRRTSSGINAPWVLPATAIGHRTTQWLSGCYGHCGSCAAPNKDSDASGNRSANETARQTPLLDDRKHCGSHVFWTDRLRTEHVEASVDRAAFVGGPV
jgi:hypothetical protein